MRLSVAPHFSLLTLLASNTLACVYFAAYYDGYCSVQLVDMGSLICTYTGHFEDASQPSTDLDCLDGFAASFSPGLGTVTYSTPGFHGSFDTEMEYIGKGGDGGYVTYYQNIYDCGEITSG